MALLNLPNEILIQIAKELDDESSMSALSRTCKHLHKNLNFVLYSHNIQLNLGSALLWAADNNQPQTARYLIERGVYVDMCSCETFQTPLIIAAAKGFTGFVELLLNNGANVRGQDIFGNTALTEAVCRQNEPLVQVLLKHGADPNPHKAGTRTLLHHAIENVRITELLLRAGARLNSCDSNEMTPLHLAVEHGKLKVVVLLLKNGANPKTTNSTGETPLHSALLQRHSITAKWLLRYGASPLSKLPIYGTPLDYAVLTNYVKAVKMLVKYGANPGLVGANGDSPLHKAARLGNPEIVRILLKHGANPWVRSPNGETPVSYAVSLRNGAVVRLLVQSDLDLHARQFFQRTPPQAWDLEPARSFFYVRGLLGATVKWVAMMS